MKNEIKIKRREFLKSGSALMLSSLLSNHLIVECLDKQNITESAKTLISEIKLQTNASLHSMTRFYGSLLELKTIKNVKTSCLFKAGDSILNFEKNQLQDESPFYHFAFNIPQNKIDEAEQWLLDRKIALIEPPDHLKDLDRHSKNVVFFRHWNAHSLFFYDPAGNIVEFIARNTLSNASYHKFSSNDILCISEIGLVVDDVEKNINRVSSLTNLKTYNSVSENFAAMGNENGLLLLMKKDTKSIFRKGRFRKIYKTEIALNGSDLNTPTYLKNHPYLISNV